MLRDPSSRWSRISSLSCSYCLPNDFSAPSSFFLVSSLRGLLALYNQSNVLRSDFILVLIFRYQFVRWIGRHIPFFLPIFSSTLVLLLISNDFPIGFLLDFEEVIYTLFLFPLYSSSFAYYPLWISKITYTLLRVSSYLSLGDSFIDSVISPISTSY